jgi:DNA-binding response OmpR family regulator
VKILIIEDEKFIGEHIKSSLEERGFSCVWFQKGENGLESAIVDVYDCIVLDRRLPDLDGLDICKKIRHHAISTPIIMLTAMADVEQKIEGLDAGADDYITKPFSADELIARLNAVVRRITFQRKPTLQIGDVELDPIKRTVKVNGESISLSNREFMLLQYLMHHEGKPLTRSQIFDHVWEEKPGTDSNVVDVYINYVRKKIDGDKKKASHIKTVRGYGYQFNEDS